MFRPAGDEKWPRRLSYGRYVHHVLLINQGLAQVRTEIHVVEHIESLDLGGSQLKHIAEPIAFTLLLNDGDAFEIAVDRNNNPIPVPTEH